MDLPELESEVQRLIGYDSIVTSGINSKGPFVDFNAKGRMVRVWIPRDGAEARRVADLARAPLQAGEAPAYQEVDY